MMLAYIEALGNLAKSSPKKGGGMQSSVIRENFLFSQQTVNANDDSPDTRSKLIEKHQKIDIDIDITILIFYVGKKKRKRKG